MIPANAKVLVLDRKHLEALMRGEGSIANLPHDGVLLGFSQGPDMALGVMVYSQTYAAVPKGEQLPAVPAILRRRPT